MALTIFASSIFGYPLFSSLAVIFNLNNRTLVVPYRALIVVISIVLILLSCLATQWKYVKIKRQKLFFLISIIFFFILFFSRAIIDSLFYLSYIDYETKSLFWQFFILTTLIPATSFSSAVNFVREEELVKWSMYIGLLCVSTTLYAYMYSTGNNLGTLFSGRISLLSLNPITIGHTGVSLMILGYIYFIKFSNGSKLNKFIALISVALGLITVLAAGSRGPILSILGCLIFIGMNNGLNLKKITYLLLVLTIINISIKSLDIYIVDRLIQSFLKDEARSSIYENTFNVINNNIFTGAGILATNIPPHNIFVESFLVTGIFGLSFFVLIVIFSILYCQTLYNQKYNYLLPLLYIQYFIYYLVSGELHEALMFWLLTFCFFTYRFNVNNSNLLRLSV